MINNLYADLEWLASPPTEFAAQCRALVQSDSDGPTVDLGKRIRWLASHSLDENQLIRLGKAIVAARRNGRSLAPLTPFRLGIIGNGTLDHLALPLIASAARHGVALDCVVGHYDQVLQEALDPVSEINSAKLDAVLIAVDYRGLPLVAEPGNAEQAQASVEAALRFLDTVANGIRQHGNALPIVQTLAAPPETLFGSRDAAVPGTTRNLIERINDELVRRVATSDSILFDVNTLAQTVGLANWHSPSQWNLAKYPFADTYLPLYAEHVGRLLGAARGKSRRVLILDLDNTLWGGVIGDDLLEGIRIAQGDAVGEAHLSVQKMALALRERGVVLAVSSKNNDDTARLPFREHPEMLLREHHFAVFQANWNDKATNIQAIAQALSLGIESMVFLDDNPVERNLVREMLPEVAVPELPDDPSLYARTLNAGGYFEALAFVAEDKQRAAFYQDNARRIALQTQAGDLDAYLKSLDMHITFAPFDDVGRSRIVQLINKSNQFNLTTRRYTEADIVQLEEEGDNFTLQIRLTDTFGDNGMISVIICRPSSPPLDSASAVANTWEIDTWLMSCRVLGRKVEDMVLCEVLAHAARRGIERVIGRYVPTERNALVKDHYAKLGFTPIGEHDDGTTVWEMSTATRKPVEHFAIHRNGFDVSLPA
jgi:FkbH-like protein